MRRPTIIELRQFYSSTLGRKVKQRLRALVVELWPDVAGQSIVGIGYTVPVLRVLERSKPASMLALMPVSQGAIYWPVHAENRSILADEMVPPFAVNSLDKVVMLHAFEHVAQPTELLKIYWQMLTPGGRLLLMVPNRHGLWSSMSNTPYMRGTPYSMAQLRELLNETQFTIRETRSLLFAPPLSRPFWLKSWGVFEWLIRWMVPNFGGVLVVEAEKQIYAAIAQPIPSSALARAWNAATPQTASPAKSF